MESQSNKTIKWKVKEAFDKIYRELRIINDKPVSDYFRTLLKQIILICRKITIPNFSTD